jgi:hypothetical protein
MPVLTPTRNAHRRATNFYSSVNSVTKNQKNKEDDDEAVDEEPPSSDIEKKYIVLLAKSALLLSKGARAQPLCAFH